MGLFTRRQPSPIPGLSDPECAAFLTAFGRERITGDFGPASQRLGPLIFPTYQQATADPEAFYGGLARCAGSSPSSWSWVGAARVVSEVGVDGFSKDERFRQLADQAFTFLRSRAIPRLYLTGYENTLWYETHPDEAWLSPLPGRPVADSPIRPIDAQEEREVAVLAGAGNRLKVSRVETGGPYAAFMYRARSSEDKTLERDPDPTDTADSLNELYLRIAAGLSSPPLWFDPELEPFFIYAAPDFSA